MQPDPISPQEKPQPESISTPEETKIEMPSAQEKKPSKRNFTAIVLGFLVFVLLVGAAGLGYWAYTLYNQLDTTEQHLNTLQASHEQLQSEHEKLKNDYDKLTSDLDQTSADLETANSDLSTAQDDLGKANKQIGDLNDNLDKASGYANIVYAWITIDNESDIFKINDLVEAADDNELQSLWDTMISSPRDENFDKFFIYLVTALKNSIQ